MKQALILFLVLCLLLCPLWGCTPDDGESGRQKPSLPAVDSRANEPHAGRDPAGESGTDDPDLPEDTGLRPDTIPITMEDETTL